MSKKDEALKLALEALEKIYIAPEHEEYIRVWWPACEQAITALREALAEQPAQRELNESDDLTIAYMAGVHRGKELAKQPSTEDSSAVEQPAQQEPVNKYCCHLCFNNSGQVFLDRMILCPECGNKRCPKATHHDLPCTKSNDVGQKGSIYDQPAQRTWVGLSTSDLDEVDAPIRERGHATIADIYRAIEAKLREKNT